MFLKKENSVYLRFFKNYNILLILLLLKNQNNNILIYLKYFEELIN